MGDPHGVSINELSLAQSLNTSIQNPDTAEAIYKSVYAIMIAMSNAGGQYIPQAANQLVILEAIAPLCPEQWGNGVFMARALLSQIDKSVWGGTCGAIAQNNDEDHSPSTHSSDSLIGAKVYPNPANTLLNIELSIEQGQTATICLYNGIGEMVKCETIYSGLTIISSTELSSGIYYYRITAQNGTLIKADKQIIMH